MRRVCRRGSPSGVRGPDVAWRLAEARGPLASSGPHTAFPVPTYPRRQENATGTVFAGFPVTMKKIVFYLQTYRENYLY